MITILAVVILALLPNYENAAEAAPRARKARYGWELEFTNSKINKSNFGQENAEVNDVNYEAREVWYEKLKEICKVRKDCKIRPLNDWINWFDDGDIYETWEVKSYRVEYTDGFWFNLSLDTAVVEVQLKPSTANEITMQKERIQKDIFDTALTVGLRPPPIKRNRKGETEETHVHIGAVSAFDMNLLQIRNALVDGVNHQELVFLFCAVPDNACPLSLLDEESFNNFAMIIAQVDSGEIKDVETFIKKIRKKVYNVTIDEDFVSEYNIAQKFQQWNVERFRKRFPADQKTLENRSMPHPQNAEDLVDLTNLQNGRVEFLRTHKNERVELKRFNPKADIKLKLANFKLWVTESGQDWEQFVRFLPRKLQKTKVATLPPTAFFRDRAKGKTCTSALLKKILAPL